MATKTKHSSETVNRLVKALMVTSRSVEEILVARAVEGAVGEKMSASKVQILRLLSERGDQTSTQVASFLGVSKPAVTQIIDAMMRSKLVSRKTAVHDRREVSLRLTAKGRQTIQAVRRRQKHLVRTAADDIGATDVKRVVSALEKLAGALVAADRTNGDFCLQCGVHDDVSCVLAETGDFCDVMRHGDRKRDRR